MIAAIRTTSSALALAVCLLVAGAGAGLAQDAAAPSQPDWPPRVEQWQSQERDPARVDPDAAQEKGLTQPEVLHSMAPPPTEQGTRPPEAADRTGEERSVSLYELLRVVRAAPPGLDGTPTPRPNPFGSEPTTEMEPVGGPEHMFPDGYVE